MGTTDSGTVGLARRRTLLNQLITEQTTALAQSDSTAPAEDTAEPGADSHGLPAA
ncbi:hypothetical protein AB0D27_28515 [Streptomyces sp. NPDC048415]|uniref:hypothetical protein n=1 Tax=Streptomyces sp. NPDC048415 TaxID=3154822 RepID=UPI003443E12A